MLDPVLLSSIGDLELVARRTVDGTISGLHRSPFHGYSAEFSQYRHYQPGDDLKHVDWKLLARTDRIYTKQYRETTNMMAQIAVDASASMAYAGAGRVSKLDYARLLAAALAHLIANQGDATGLVIYDDHIRQYLPSRVGQPQLRALLVALARMQASGPTTGGLALRRATDLLKRRGLLLVISDLYDEDASMEQALRRAVTIGHEIALFHVLTREEVDFPFAGEFEMQDLESGRTVLVGQASVDGYRREFGAFLDRWRSRCTRNGIDYTHVITDMPLDEALRSYLLRRRGGPAR
jgi:uncharacterized protein (DUF58 family)